MDGDGYTVERIGSMERQLQGLAGEDLVGPDPHGSDGNQLRMFGIQAGCFAIKCDQFMLIRLIKQGSKRCVLILAPVPEAA